ncbi:hypothetical protein, partial [Mannheimia haemolytica]
MFKLLSKQWKAPPLLSLLNSL